MVEVGQLLLLFVKLSIDRALTIVGYVGLLCYFYMISMLFVDVVVCEPACTVYLACSACLPACWLICSLASSSTSLSVCLPTIVH